MRNRVFAIILLTIFSRLFFAVCYPGLNYYNGISQGYVNLNDNVIAGRGLVVLVDLHPSASAMPQWSYAPFIDRPLGYFFLSILPYRFFGPMGIQILQVLLSVGSVLLLFRIARFLFSERIAWISATLYAVWPLSARFEVTILPDAVTSFFLLLGIWALIRSFRGGKPVMFQLLSGIAFGCGTLMRADVMLLPVFILPVLYLVHEVRATLRCVGLVIVGMAIVILPHAIRNYAVTNGEIVPIGLGNGISMWEGISQFGDTLGTVHADEDLVKLEGYQSWCYPDGVQRDKARFAQAIGIVKDHPLWFLGVMIRRIPLLLKPDGIITSRFMPTPKQFFADHPGTTYLDLFQTFPFWSIVQLLLITAQFALIALAVLGIFRYRQTAFVWIAVAGILYYFMVHITTNTEPRYFYPVIPFLILLASAGGDSLRMTHQRT